MISRIADRHTTLGVALLLTVSGFAVYGATLGHPFLIDDQHIILNDPRVQTANFAALLTEQYWPGEHGNQVYRPLTSLSLALNWLASHEAWTFRLTNLLLHISVGLGVFLLARKITGSRGGSLVAALLFITHPIHTTPLNQIVDRADIAAALCVVFATWLYIKDNDPTAGRSWLRPLVAALLAAAGLMCKENAVTLVGVVLLCDACRGHFTGNSGLGTRLLRRTVRCYGPLLAVLAIYILVRATTLGGLARDASTIPPLDNIVAQADYGLEPGDSRFLARWGTPMAVFGRAVGLLFWPHPLSWDYSYAAIDQVRSWGDPGLWLGIGTLAIAIILMALSWRRRRQTCLAIGILLVTFSVVSNTVIVIGAAFAERYLYLPSVGYCLLIGSVVGVAWKHVKYGAQPRKRLTSAAVLTIAMVAGITYAGLTIVRNRDFATANTLNQRDLRTHPQSARLLASVAADAMRAGDYACAIRRAKQAVTIYPEYVLAWRVAGAAHLASGDARHALECYQRSFDLGGTDNENAVTAVASILKSGGDYSSAIRLLQDFLDRHPGSALAHNNLAWYLITAQPIELRDPQRALQHAEQAIKQEPTAADFLDTYTSALKALQKRG